MTKLQDFLNSPIPNVSRMQRGGRVGDLFGVELECEGKRVEIIGDGEILKAWAPHQDGSLRANHGGACEWVFNGPVSYKTSYERINLLFDHFQKNNSKIVCSNRTSCHVHFNMADKNVYQLVNLFILFTIFEDIMDSYCGEDRNGNLFCLSSRHAEDQVRWVEDACFRKHVLNFDGNMRYCSLNLASINKFGTVEFRGMRGLDTREGMLEWLEILNEFCMYACYKMKNPVTVIEQISAKTPLGFMKEVFSEANVRKLTAGMNEAQINGSVYEGLRLVQMLCYRIGTEFDQVRLRGRDFWASFKDDQEPVLDVDPDDLLRNPPPAGRRARARPVGLGGAAERINGLQELERANQRAAQRIREAQRAAAAVQAPNNIGGLNPNAAQARDENPWWRGQPVRVEERRIRVRPLEPDPRPQNLDEVFVIGDEGDDV